MRSTIERAMQKLSGEPVPEGSDDEDVTLPVESTAEAVEPVIDLREQITPPIVPPEVTPSVPIVAQPVEEAPQIAVPAPLEHLDYDIHIDFQRLAGLNFLIPGDTRSQLAEEFQHIKRRLLGATLQAVPAGMPPLNLIMVTSSVPGEGKTFTSANLALSIAMEMDRTVLVVDTDIAKSDLTRLFGAYGRTGLYDVLSTPGLDIGDVILRTNIPKLAIVPAGTIREAVSEKLASDAMRMLTLELAERYGDRIVLFDCPPVLATSGAAALAPLIGQIIMVVESWKTPRSTIRHALQMIEPYRPTGMVLNKTRQLPEGASYYYYRYGYGYGAPKAAGS